MFGTCGSKCRCHCARSLGSFRYSPAHRARSLLHEAHSFRREEPPPAATQPVLSQEPNPGDFHRVFSSPSSLPPPQPRHFVLCMHLRPIMFPRIENKCASSCEKTFIWGWRARSLTTGAVSVTVTVLAPQLGRLPFVGPSDQVKVSASTDSEKHSSFSRKN